MRWPWRRIIAGDQLVVSWSGGELAYVRARARSDGGFDVRELGVERQGTDSRDDFVRRLQALGLKGASTYIMLRPAQYQLLQIDVPAVAPEELRAAARYQIRDMVNVHIDDLTLDVMQVGDGQQKGTPHLFVVAAETAVIRDALALGDALSWTVSVIDIQETVQRNLQSLLARTEGRLDRADAALLVADSNHALLTISANEELFYARRLELPAGFMSMDWGSQNAEAGASADAFIPVDEYVPEYNVGGVSHGSDYTAASSSSGDGAGNELAQRFVVEVQRSLDLWDRSWSSLPLSGLRVSAGERSTELAQWLGREMGQSVIAMDMGAHFSGIDTKDAADRASCLPLLGALLRTEARKL